MTDLPDSAIGPLVGFRVLDLSTMIAASFSTSLLADFGAEVIKVELPGQGDTLRNVAPVFADRSLYWSVLSRNKLLRHAGPAHATRPGALSRARSTQVTRSSKISGRTRSNGGI